MDNYVRENTTAVAAANKGKRKKPKMNPLHHFQVCSQTWNLSI